ncbi:MAG: glycosyltransferase family 39 protein, partial [Anaerolineae bacterium]|nr:glycosyltransferase family 39 protein [Anaerolineae bacterium]
MPGKNTREIWLGSIILVLAAGLRLYGLAAPSLWHDEAFTWFFTRLAWFEMLDTVRLDGVNPPVYYLGVKLFIGWLGEGELGLRLLSAAAGVGAVYAAWLLGREAGGRMGGVAGAGLVAFHPMAVHYARDARPYGLVSLLSVLLVLAFLRLRRGGTRLAWGAALLLLVLGQLSHYFFFVLGGALVGIAVVDLKRRRVFFRRWVLVWIAGFVPLALWMWWYFSQPTPSLGIGWIDQPNWQAPLGTWWNLFSGYGGVLAWPVMVFGSLNVCLAALAVFRAKDRRTTQMILWLGLILPVLGVWMISQRRAVYVDRYFIVLLPFVVYLVSVGAQVLGERMAAWEFSVLAKRAALLIWAVLGLWVGWQVQAAPQYGREDWRGLIGFIEEHSEAKPLLWLSEPEASIPIQYYYRGNLESAVSGANPLLCSSPCWWVL